MDSLWADLQAWIGAHYQWIKAIHIMAVIAWMAALFYQPRLFVYHAMAAPGSDAIATFKVMQHKLEKVIMTPAMVVALATGLLMLAMLPWSLGWVQLKVAGVAGMLGFHGACMHWRRVFARDANRHGHKFYRLANEVPTLLMILIVIMAVVEPI